MYTKVNIYVRTMAHLHGATTFAQPHWVVTVVRALPAPSPPSPEQLVYCFRLQHQLRSYLDLGVLRAGYPSPIPEHAPCFPLSTPVYKLDMS